MELFKNDQILNVIEHYLSLTQKEICLHVPEIGYPSIIKQLIEKNAQNVQVRIIISKPIPDIATLPYVHIIPNIQEKYCIIDEKYVFFGDFTWYPPIKETESIFLSSSAETIEEFYQKFQKNLSNTLADNTLSIYDYYREKQEIQELQNICLFLETRIQEIQSYYITIEQYLKLHLGEKMLKKLELEKELLRRKYEQLHKKVYEIEANEKEKEYQKYYAQWRQIEQQAETIQKRIKTPISDKIKELYRKIAQKIHPDRFINDPERYKKANEWFIKANKAYQEQNADELLHIWQMIEHSWETLETDATTPDAMQKKLAFWQARKQELENTLINLQKHEFYPIFAKQISLEEYTEQLRQQLENDIRILLADLNQIKI